MITTITNKIKDIKIKDITFNILPNPDNIVIKIKCKKKDITFDDVILDLELSKMIMHNHNLSIDTYCSEVLHNIVTNIKTELGIVEEEKISINNDES